MCSNYGLIPRTDPRFPLLPVPNPRISPLDPNPRLSFNTHIPSPRVSVHRRVGSHRTGAAVNDGSVTAPPSPHADMMSFYELLGIPETGTLVEIKQGYKQMARRYHPDVSPPGRVEEYTQRFIRVQEAYETLSDPRLRALYDRDMAKGLHFAFSARRNYQSDEPIKEKSEWKSRWQSQLSELKRRSMHKDTSENMSWGARMRRQRNES